MKITTTRRISQAAFFALFIWFCIVNTVGAGFHQIRGWTVNLFLWLDPLTGFATVLTTHRLWQPLILSMLTICVTIVLGRIFCGWICPLGTVGHFVGFVGQKSRRRKEKIDKGRSSKYQRIKYLILFIFIGLTCFGVGFSLLQTGLLAPIPLFTRSVSNALLPILDSQSSLTMATNRHYEGAAMVLVLFTAIVLLNLLVPRFFCRFLGSSA